MPNKTLNLNVTSARSRLGTKKPSTLNVDVIKQFDLNYYKNKNDGSGETPSSQLCYNKEKTRCI